MTPTNVVSSATTALPFLNPSVAVGAHDTARFDRPTALPATSGRDEGLIRSVVQPVERQARLAAETSAVVHSTGSISYDELNRRANRWARRLISLGAAADTAVGVMLSRSCELPAAVLAVLKSGAAYLPLDPTYPAQRLAAMYDQSRPLLVLVDDATARHAPPGGEAYLSIEQLEQDANRLSDGDLPARAAQGDLAYVIFTSGSTGRPKGVAMPHGPLVNLLRWQVAQWSGRPPMRTMQFAPLSFDVSFQEIFGAWWTGGTVILPDEPIRKDPVALVAFLREHAIERAFLPVVALQMLAETLVRRDIRLPDLREVITAGEQLEITPAVRAMFASHPDCQLINQYGPSETHVVTQFVLGGSPEAWPQLPPIGRPIDQVVVQLFDSEGREVEKGQTGEVYIGGSAVARGYLNQPELTAERFLPDPRGGRGAARMYKTGDLARRLPRGDLEFLGRIDQQIKIRGFRVELEEIRGCLAGYPGVAQGVVFIDGAANGEKQLIAAVTPANEGELTREEILDHLRISLPDYMIPSVLVVLRRLPVTANGKVDHAAVIGAAQHAACESRETTDGADSALPATAVELRVWRLWREVLGRNRFGVDDSLLELGASSLQVARVAAGLEPIAGRAVSVAELVNHPTIRSVSEHLQNGRPTAETSALICLRSPGLQVPAPAAGGPPPIFLVHPGGGNALCYLPLARALGDARPVYAFQARGVDSDDEPISDVGEMAASYLVSMREVQPHGPYALAGWSFGGLVVFEMARQLQAAGEETSLVGVIDAGKLYGFQVMRTLFPNDEFGLFDLLRRPSSEQVESFQARTALAQLVPPAADAKLAARIYKIFLTNAKALLDFRPEPLSGRVDLFLGREPLGSGRRNPIDEWNELCDDLQVHYVPGNHLSLIHPPHVADLAEALGARLSLTRVACPA